MHANRWRILHIVNLGTFISTLDVGIVNVALPTMAEQFGVSLAQIQWIVTGYLLTMVLLLPFLGKLSDRLGRHNVYSTGFFVFGIGSLFAGISGSLTALVVARIVQGVGATMIMANSQAMVRTIFPDHERGKALGFNAVIISVGTLSGPALGGMLLGVMGWEGLFLLNVPLGVVGLWAGLRWFPKIKLPVTGRLDMIGTLMLGGFSVLLVYAAEQSAAAGFSQTVVLLSAIALLCLLLLIAYEVKIKDGILDRELFTNRMIVLGNSSAFLMHLVQSAAIIPITFYFQYRLGFSPWLIGLLLCLQPIMMGIFAPIGGWYRDRSGAFVPLIVAPIVAALSFLIVVFTPDGMLPFAIFMSLHLALFGIASGLFQSTNNAEIMTAAPDQKVSHAGSMLALIRYMGMIIGTGMAAAFVGSMGAVSEVTDMLADHNGPLMDQSLRLLFLTCFVLALGVVWLALLRPKVNKL